MNMSSVKLKGLLKRQGRYTSEGASTNCLSETLHTSRLVTQNEILIHAEEEATKGLTESNGTCNQSEARAQKSAAIPRPFTTY